MDSVGTMKLTLDERLADLLDLADGRQGRRVVDVHDAAVGLQDLVGDVRRGLDEGDALLALEALLDDLHVQEPEEAAAEAEAERFGGLGLVRERGVVEAQALERLPQRLVVGVRRRDRGRRRPSAAAPCSR